MISRKYKVVRTIVLGFMVMAALVNNAQEKETDAVYLKLVKEYVLHEDGSFDYHYHKDIKLNTYFSVHRLYGETFIIYNPEYQELIINDCYTVMADGTRVKAPENAFNEVLPRYAADAAKYNHLREMVVTHTGLEPGAIITLDYTIRSRSGFMPYLMGSEIIGEEMPVNEMNIIVRVPNEARLVYEVKNLRTAPDIMTMGKQTSYIWTFKGLRARSRENFQVGERIPELVFSTARDLQWAYFTFINQDAFRHDIGGEISKKTEQVLANKTDEVDIMLALQDIVIDELRLAEIPLSINGYRVRTADEAWQSAYATALEKAILLAGMLRKANINAAPVALIPKGSFDRNMGNLESFGEFMVQVNLKKYDRVYLSVTRKNEQNEIYNMRDQVAVLLDGAVESLRYFEEKPVKDRLSLSGELSLADTAGLSGELRLVTTGAKNPSLKLRRDPDALKSLISGGIASSSVNSYEIEKQTFLETQASLEIKAGVASDFKGSYLFFNLPQFTNGFHEWSAGSFSEERESALRLPGGLEENYSLEISVPEGYELVSPQNLIGIENEAGKLFYRIQLKSGKILLEKSLLMNGEIIEPDNYQDFLELLQTWETDYLQRLVFLVKR